LKKRYTDREDGAMAIKEFLLDLARAGGKALHGVGAIGLELMRAHSDYESKRAHDVDIDGVVKDPLSDMASSRPGAYMHLDPNCDGSYKS
jgi:hypothetical protein